MGLFANVVEEPLSCFDGAESEGLATDVIASWRTRKPLAPLPMISKFGRPWSSSGPLAVSGGQLLVVDEAGGRLVRLAQASLKTLGSVAVGKRPAHVLVGPDGTAWVTLRGESRVVAVVGSPAGKNSVAKKIEVGAEPIGMAMSDDGTRLFVATAGGARVVALSTVTGKSISELSFDVPGRPRALALIDLGGKPSTERIVVAMQNGPAFVRHVKLGSITTFDNRLVPLRGANPGHVAAGGNVELDAWRAISVTVSPATGRALIPHVLVNSGDDVGGMPAEQGGGDAYGSSSAACSGTPLRPVELAISEIGHNLRPTVPQRAVRDPFNHRQLIAGFDQPSAIAHHPSATLAFVTAAGTDNVLVVNTALPDPMAAPLGEFRTGEAPDAVAVATDGKRAFVRCEYGAAICVLKLDKINAMVSPTWLRDDNDAPIAPRLAPRFLDAQPAVAFAKDALTARQRAGRRLFTHARDARVSKAGRFACATCHLEGGEDKQVWRIGDGPRQTPALAGRLVGTEPFNWKGTQTDLVGNMRQTIERMGGHGLNGKDEHALRTFLVTGLHEPANAHRRKTGLTAAQKRGQKLFFDPQVACASCHPPPFFTDGKQHQIGTIATPAGNDAATHCSPEVSFATLAADSVFDTPSLLGAHATGPYLHDGSAATLEDVLALTAGKMGNTAHLTTAQRSDLVAFLKTL